MTYPKNIFAHTEPGADFPAYLSINAVGNKVDITVRSPKERGGATATITLSEALFAKMRVHLKDHVTADDEATARAFMENTV
jgi:hypothetical protein